MKITQYISQEKAISAADGGGIRQRRLYGLRLLRDSDVMSPGGGGLRHGVTDQLMSAAKARGFRLSDREIRRRIQCARAYPTEAQIGRAVADFSTWRDLADAGFPAIPLPDGEPDADHRTVDEKRHDAARALAELIGEQGSLFPLSQFEPADASLKELLDYTEQQEELTARFAEHGRKRREYLDSLIAAAGGGDLSKTWHEAHSAAFGSTASP